MAQIICTRPNASELISGVKFEKTDEGMLSEEISDEQAAAFTAIPGYALIVDEKAVAQFQLAKNLGEVGTLVNAVIQEFAEAQSEGIEAEAVVEEAARRLPLPDSGKRDTRKQRVRQSLKGLTTGDDAPYFLEDGCLSIL